MFCVLTGYFIALCKCNMASIPGWLWLIPVLVIIWFYWDLVRVSARKRRALDQANEQQRQYLGGPNYDRRISSSFPNGAASSSTPNTRSYPIRTRARSHQNSSKANSSSFSEVV